MPDRGAAKIMEICFTIDAHLASHNPAHTPDRSPLTRLLSALGRELDEVPSLGEERGAAAAVAGVAVQMLSYFQGHRRHSSALILEAEACRLLADVATIATLPADTLPNLCQLLTYYSSYPGVSFGSLQAISQACKTVAALAGASQANLARLVELGACSMLVEILLKQARDVQVRVEVASALEVLAGGGQVARQQIVDAGGLLGLQWLLKDSMEDEVCREQAAATYDAVLDTKGIQAMEEKPKQGGARFPTPATGLQSQTAGRQARDRRQAVKSVRQAGATGKAGGGRAGAGASKKAAGKRRPAPKPAVGAKKRRGANEEPDLISVIQPKRKLRTRKAVTGVPEPPTGAGSGDVGPQAAEGQALPRKEDEGLPLPLAASAAEPVAALTEGNQGRRVQPPRKAKTLSKGQENVTAAAACGKARAKKETRRRA